jgi:hypothetical protein
MRIMLIEPTAWRIRYIKLYCALRIMQPDQAPAMGARGCMRSRSMAFVMNNLLYDSQNERRMEDGRPRCSESLRNQIHGLERQLRDAAGELQIE